MDLDNLKYSELQKLAKSAGIRANQKIDKLVKALKVYFDSHTDETTSNLESDNSNATQKSEHLHKDEKIAREKPANKKARAVKKGGITKSKKDIKRKTEDCSSYLATAEKQSEMPMEHDSSGTPKISKTKPSEKTRPAIVNPASGRTPLTPLVKKKTAIVISPGTPAMKRMPTNVTPPSSRTPEAGKLSAHGDPKESGKSSRSAGARSMPGYKNGDARKSTPKTSAIETSAADTIITVKSAGLKRKRNSTFELEEATLGVHATPEVEKTAKESRLTGTPVTQNDHTSNSSPGMQDMLDSMTGVMSSTERRKRLMSVIDKKIETKVKHSPHAGPSTQIPRFAAFLAKRKQEQKKPITPGNKDWEKVHKKEFSKFDSIDVYLEKKRKRAEEMTASVKKARTVLHEVQEAVTKLRSKRTPSLGEKKSTQPFKPSVFSTKNMNLNFGTTASATKTPNNRKSRTAFKPFRPTVTSTKEMNLNFSSVKTPITAEARRQTPSNGASSGRKSVGPSQMSARKSLGASVARKSSINTPFCFTGNLNMSDARSVNKPVFDLKASLARPITWKPHVGKLKPIDANYKNLEGSVSKPAPANRMDIFKSAVNKTRITYSRQDRRAAATAKRTEKKNNQQMKRRGIIVAP